jgi:methionyl-tRNA formyltransferase
MKILLLSPDNTEIFSFLDRCGEVTRHEDRLSLIKDLSIYDWVISFGFRHIISKIEIDKCKNPIINLHISYLPYNRGADPNFWSWYENTPKGVTIHFIDEGIDTGDILTQKIVSFSGDETLSSSYEVLKKEIINLFIGSFEKIISGEIIPESQKSKGSYHEVKDLQDIREILTKGWETPVAEINDRFRDHRRDRKGSEQK